MGGAAEAEIRQLKAGAEKDLFLFGSADFAASLMKAGLIDEYRLCVTPVVLGGGSPLFKTLPQPVRFELVETRPLKSGAVILTYRPAAAL
jgi:dihydrofolate reductase